MLHRFTTMMYSFESNSDLNESNRELDESFRPYIIVLILELSVIN